MPFCITAPDILLPKKGTDYSRWAVIACDQFTSERQYWEDLKKYVGESVSALNVILPEAYLLNDNSKLIGQINGNMQKYISDGVFTTHESCFVYVERQTPYTKKRRGLVAAVDLEAYSFYDKDKALIRATEGTVLSRIPPRVQIRQNALIELPHIMILVDDREKSVIEPLEKYKNEKNKLYGFELNMGGGRIEGYKIKDTDKVTDKFKALLNPALLKEKYGLAENLLLAVGDGNHSLASAKTCWDNIKLSLTEKERENHPARFALAEIVNIHDEGLKFEPIHRVIFNADGKFKEKLIGFCSKYGGVNGSVYYNGKKEPLKLPKNAASAVEEVQSFIDAYVKDNGAKVDYIHGEESVKSICDNENATGVLLPALKKEDLFMYLIKKGSLPRKTFSMGEACEKRYYIEARRIK